jgi:DHA1 family inner membrane transport protein
MTTSLNTNTDTAQSTNPMVLYILALCVFCVGTAEFMMAGILPDIANTFHVSIPMVGWLMSGYAAGVIVSAPLITLVTLRCPRKILLVILMGVFIVGNIISATASSYSLLMLGRILSSLCHGAFFGIGATVAANSVAPENKSKAIALMFTGITVANVLGVPLGTWVGQQLGWRALFWVLVAMSMIGLLGLMLLLPYKKITDHVSIGLELKVLKHKNLWQALAVTALGFGSVFAVFAFISPLLVHVGGFLQVHMTWLLLVFGLGLVVGNLFGGRIKSHQIASSVSYLLIALALVLGLFYFTLGYSIILILNLFIFGFFGFAIVSPVQTQVLIRAQQAPTLASSMNIAAFNVGIAIGTYLSGLSIHLGYGFISIIWVSIALVVAALLVQLSSYQRKIKRRSA